MPYEAGVRVLAVGRDADELLEIRRTLEAPGTGLPRQAQFEVVTSPDLDDALVILGRQSFDAALLSVSTSDPGALRAADDLRERHPALPLILVLDRDDEKLAVEAAAHGVQDCVVRSELVGNLLARSLKYAMERQELHGQLERRSVIDELTGLYNRRGFFAVGEQEWKRARRTKESCLLVFADVDGLKTVNDREGHEAGDALIRSAAELLAAVFRDTDILARLGGDEFAVIARVAGSGGETAIRERLARGLAERERDPARHPLSVSVGVVQFEPGEQTAPGLDELLSRADALMYEDKKTKKAGR
jgi:two-component system, cell cycle response regulator